VNKIDDELFEKQNEVAIRELNPARQNRSNSPAVNQSYKCPQFSPFALAASFHCIRPSKLDH
jgi:hypothetical protein